MGTADVVVLVIAALALVVVLVGVSIARRRDAANEARLKAQLAEANAALADAHAQDKGWDRSTLEAAARAAAGGTVDELHLVQVVDRPGTDADEAVFVAVSGSTRREVRLGRRDGEWVPAAEAPGSASLS